MGVYAFRALSSPFTSDQTQGIDLLTWQYLTHKLIKLKSSLNICQFDVRTSISSLLKNLGPSALHTYQFPTWCCNRYYNTLQQDSAFTLSSSDEAPIVLSNSLQCQTLRSCLTAQTITPFAFNLTKHIGATQADIWLSGGNLTLRLRSWNTLG